jgi:2-C-methyl-D-erythritol 2,4-cyclodiphosphate synthase
VTGTPDLRVGIGVDVHPYDPSRPLHLAGLHWPDEAGLAGHSDGDAAAHACCDALFSAAGLGDLGSQYGTSAPEWAGAAGVELLAESAARVRAAGWDVVNVAVQVIGVKPRLGERRAEAERALTEAASAPVSLAATTTDGLGLTGRGEGLAAVATALLRRG